MERASRRGGTSSCSRGEGESATPPAHGSLSASSGADEKPTCRSTTSPLPSPALTPTERRDATAEHPVDATAAAAESPVAAPDSGVGFEPPRALDTVAWPSLTLPDGGLATVRLSLLVDADGEVSEVEILEAASGAPADLALHAAAGLRFTPATLDGAPVAVRLEVLVPSALPPPVALATVRGEVRSRGTRRPIPFASLLAADAGATEADGEGRFTLALPAGRHVIEVRAPAFEADTFTESLAAGQRTEVVYALTPTVPGAFETVVRGTREVGGPRRVELRGPEIREVPGTLGDPFRVVMVMPGVASVVSGVAWPVVRGSSPAATGYFLDGIRVPQLFHLFLGPGVVHPDFIDGVDFYAGGAPAQYSRVLGGVVEGRLARSTEKEVRASAQLDLLNAGAFVDVPFERTGTRVSLAGRVGSVALLAPFISTTFFGPDTGTVLADYGDYQARVEQKLSFGDARLFVFGSSDRFGSTFEARLRDSALEDVAFHRVDGRVRARLGTGELELGLTLGVDRIGFDVHTRTFDFPDTIDVALAPSSATLLHRVSTISESELSPRLTWRTKLSDALSLSAGGTWDRITAGFDQRLDVTPPSGDPATATQSEPVALANLFGGWTSLQWTGPHGLAATAGARVDHWHLVPGLDRTTFDPRASATWSATAALSFRASAGLFHQPPTFLIALPVVDVASLRAGLQEGVQTSVGVTWRTWRGLELSADVYVNPLLRSIELGIFDDEEIDYRRPITASSYDSSVELVPPPAAPRPGLAVGVDLMARLPLSARWFGWATVSVSRATRLTEYALYAPNGKNTGTAEAWLPYAFDQTLVANAVLSYRVGYGVSVGGVLHLNTGRPESGQIGSRTHVPGVDASGAPLGQWVRAARPDVDRLPPYVRVDLRVAKTWVFDTFLLEGYLDVLNVTVSGEVTGYSYERLFGGTLVKTANTLPVILPNLGLKGRY